MDKRDIAYILFLLILLPYGFYLGITNNTRMFDLSETSYNTMKDAGCVDESDFFIDSLKCNTIYEPFSNLPLFSILYLISIPFGILGILALILMGIWMVVDVTKRKEFTTGKKIAWIIAFMVISISIMGYFADIKRKDWDPEGKQKKLIFALTAIWFVLFMALAFIGIFYGF